MSIIAPELLKRYTMWEFLLITRKIHFLGSVSLQQLIASPQMRLVVKDPIQDNKLDDDLKNALLKSTIRQAEFGSKDFRYVLRLFEGDKLIFQVAMDSTMKVGQVNTKQGYIDGELKLLCVRMEKFFMG